jgi:hypothetical protein
VCLTRETSPKPYSTGQDLGTYFLKSVPICEICGSMPVFQASRAIQPRDLTDTDN